MVNFLESRTSMTINVVEPDKPKLPLLAVAVAAVSLYILGKGGKR